MAVETPRPFRCGDAADVERLARAFGSNVILHGTGEAGSLRSVATANGVPTITVEMGKAHRFQPALVEKAVDGVGNVLADLDVLPDAEPTAPKWRTIVGGDQEKRWLRADTGGLVDMQWGPQPLVHEGETICTKTDHFRHEEHVVAAPFTGLVVGRRRTSSDGKPGSARQRPREPGSAPRAPAVSPRPCGRRDEGRDRTRDRTRRVRRLPELRLPVDGRRGGGGVTTGPYPGRSRGVIDRFDRLSIPIFQ